MGDDGHLPARENASPAKNSFAGGLRPEALREAVGVLVQHTNYGGGSPIMRVRRRAAGRPS